MHTPQDVLTARFFCRKTTFSPDVVRVSAGLVQWARYMVPSPLPAHSSVYEESGYGYFVMPATLREALTDLSTMDLLRADVRKNCRGSSWAQEIMESESAPWRVEKLLREYDNDFSRWLLIYRAQVRAYIQQLPAVCTQRLVKPLTHREIAPLSLIVDTSWIPVSDTEPKLVAVPRRYKRIHYNV